jgi:hypothetical protein
MCPYLCIAGNRFHKLIVENRAVDLYLLVHFKKEGIREERESEKEHVATYSLVSTKLDLSLSKMVTFNSLLYFIMSRHQFEEAFGTDTHSSEML